MKKIAYIDLRAERELSTFPKTVEEEFRSLIGELKAEGLLKFPDARKITRGIYEMRVHSEGIYRGFYAYVEKQFIVILHFYHKKSQKTPAHHIKTAEHRFKSYE